MGNPAIKALRAADAAKGIPAGRMVDLAEKAKAARSQAGQIPQNIEDMLDDALGASGPSIPLPSDPKPEASDTVFGLAESAPPGKTAFVTPRKLLSRWYENVPGGFDGAVENSQKALREYGVPYPHSNDPPYGIWPKENVDSRVRVRLEPTYAGNLEAPRGTYGNGVINMNPDMVPATKARAATLEHEATHHMLLNGLREPGEPSIVTAMREANRRERFDSTPEGSSVSVQNPEAARMYTNLIGTPFEAEARKAVEPLLKAERYSMARVEMDPRIAEVRRRYAYHTGKDVTNPEEAAKAWEWYKANRSSFEGLNQYEFPTMQPSQFNMYDSLPDESKRIMFTRMAQVPALMAPIAAGGLLNGLREDR